jgi:hypothetical protein
VAATVYSFIARRKSTVAVELVFISPIPMIFLNCMQACIAVHHLFYADETLANATTKKYAKYGLQKN